MLEVQGADVALGGRTVLRNLDLSFQPHSFVGILGPNGSGKTTLLRLLTGGVRPEAGSAELFGRSLSAYTPVQIARLLGVVPQSFSLDSRFTVAEVVGLGRYPHWRLLGSRGSDEGPIRRALEELSIDHLADRPVTRLSGGERQRVLIAQTLAQETPVLLFDEPLNNLDLNHQLEVMQLLRRLHEAGRTVLVILHDINVAAQYCEELIMLSEGRVVARGRAEALLTPELVLEVFATRVAVHRQGGRPYITPLAVTPPEETLGAAQFQVHVIAGGGAGSELMEALVHRGFVPTVGAVSVFDSDYVTARDFGLEVVSAPPFEALPDDAVAEHQDLIGQASCVILAPQVYGRGNVVNLELALEAALRGQEVVVITEPPVSERDLSGGRATRLEAELRAAGAATVPGVEGALARVCGVCARGPAASALRGGAPGRGEPTRSAT